MISAFLINSLAAFKNNGEGGKEGGKARGDIWSWRCGDGQVLCGLSRKSKVLPSFQRLRGDWFQFEEGIASWRGGREWGWGIPCIKQPVRIWVIPCQVSELGAGCAGSAQAIEGDRLSWDMSLTHLILWGKPTMGNTVPPPSASSTILELL